MMNNIEVHPYIFELSLKTFLNMLIALQASMYINNILSHFLNIGDDSSLLQN